jgi:hypothetical protein
MTSYRLYNTIMYRAQFKRQSPYESWTTIGHYGSEQSAVSAALQRKNQGMLMVRVIDKSGAVIFSN